MKRKIALIICLVMIAAMIMTVLVACGEEESFYLDGIGNEEWKTINIKAGEELIVNLYDQMDNFGHHYYEIISYDAPIKYAFASKIPGTRWGKSPSKTNLSAGTTHSSTFEMFAHKSGGDWCEYEYRLYISAEANTRVHIKYGRYEDEMNTYSSYIWTTSYQTASDRYGVSDYSPLVKLYLTKEDANLLGGVLQNDSVNSAIRRLSGQNAVSVSDVFSVLDNAFSTTADAYNNAMDHDYYMTPGDGTIQIIANLLVNVIDVAVSYFTLKNDIKDLADELSDFNDFGGKWIKVVTVYKKNNGLGYDIKSTSDYSSSGCFTITGEPLYGGSFRRY